MPKQRTHRKEFLLSFNDIGRRPPTFDEAAFIADRILAAGYEADRIDIVHNHYKCVSKKKAFFVVV